MLQVLLMGTVSSLQIIYIYHSPYWSEMVGNHGPRAAAISVWHCLYFSIMGLEDSARNNVP